MRKRVAVVGGGIAGLAAAVRIRDRAPADTEIIVYEQSGVLGGKLRTGDLAGTVLERGAESFLTGAPDGTESAATRLAKRLGLSLVHPAAVPASLAAGGELSPFPAGTLMGIPERDDPPGEGPLITGDVPVGELVRKHYGDDVVDTWVDPLLGGVYAGHADQLSLDVTLPALAAAARVEQSLGAAVRRAKATSVRVPGRPIFSTVEGGLSRLIAAAAATAGARISLGLPVRELSRTAHGWRLLLGPVPAPQTDDVDAVVLAVPARPAARLLAGVVPEASEAVGELDYASVALAAFALPPGAALPELSGFLVPPGEGTLVKAATFVGRKWPHLGGAHRPVVVRASLGRYGEQDRLQYDDAVLIARAYDELGRLLGAPLPTPVATWLQRWGGALPQYRPGHRDRVAVARAAVAAAGGLAVAGAALDGVGIPACVASGERAADDVVKTLEDR